MKKFRSQISSSSTDDALVADVLAETNTRTAIESGPTLLKPLKAASQWEAWVAYRLDTTVNDVYENAYTYDVFTIRKFFSIHNNCHNS